MTVELIKRPLSIEAKSVEPNETGVFDANFVGRSPRFTWTIDTYSQDSITWQAPSSFVLYTDGSYALAIDRLINNYDSYGPFDRHFSVRFYWYTNYINAQGKILARPEIVAGEAGYKATIPNVVINGVDGAYNYWKDQISSATGGFRWETFYFFASVILRFTTNDSSCFIRRGNATSFLFAARVDAGLSSPPPHGPEWPAADGTVRIGREYARRAHCRRPTCRAWQGDTLVVTKLDRLARSVVHLGRIIDALEGKGVALRIVCLGVDTSTPTGKLMLNVLGGVGQFEREMMLERQREAIAKAKAAGRYKGRKPTARAKAGEVKALAAQGLSMAKIAAQLGIGVGSVHRVLTAVESA